MPLNHLFEGYWQLKKQTNSWSQDFFSVDLISLCLSALLSQDRHPIACYACGVRLNKLNLGGGSGDKINFRQTTVHLEFQSKPSTNACVPVFAGENSMQSGHLVNITQAISLVNMFSMHA